MSRALALSSGWHYPLDWVWVISQLGGVDGMTVLDAGAGIGLMQWLLAARGANVISVDRSDRRCVPLHLVHRFRVSGSDPGNGPLTLAEILGRRKSGIGWSKRLITLARSGVGEWRCRRAEISRARGSVHLLRRDLAKLSSLPDSSVDLIVSISALEHNPTVDAIVAIVRELRRVLRPGGRMLVTVSAALDADWYYESAGAWNLSEASLRCIFGLGSEAPSNYSDFPTLMASLRASSLLRRDLSLRYYVSRKSGMPFGRWKPMYVPVGISLTKA